MRHVSWSISPHLGPRTLPRTLGNLVDESQDFCYKYYYYFKYDTDASDFIRQSNPEVGLFLLCSQEWGVGLLVLMGLTLTCVLMQVILHLIALLV